MQTLGQWLSHPVSQLAMRAITAIGAIALIGGYQELKAMRADVNDLRHLEPRIVANEEKLSEGARYSYERAMEDWARQRDIDRAQDDRINRNHEVMIRVDKSLAELLVSSRSTGDAIQELKADVKDLRDRGPE